MRFAISARNESGFAFSSSRTTSCTDGLAGAAFSATSIDRTASSGLFWAIATRAAITCSSGDAGGRASTAEAATGSPATTSARARSSGWFAFANAAAASAALPSAISVQP
jgi:hypothetical protein